MPKCLTCHQDFIVEDDEQEFCQRIEVPEPVRCPGCRQQRRLAWRCERSLNYRKCDLCGKEHMSSYRSNAEFPVYCLDCWYGDNWNQLKQGRDYDFSRPFFEQFKELIQVSPRASLFVTQGTIINSDYCNAVTAIKNCYLIFGSNEAEDSFYCNFIKKCSNLCDCTEVYRSELCFDCVNCDQCYGLIGCDNCRGCRDSAFLDDCSGCHDCFACVNLRNQKFCLWNKQLSESEYKKERKKIDLTNRKIYQTTREKFEKFRQNQGIYQYYHGFNNIKSTGDYINRCKNSKFIFDCYELEDCKYVTRVNGAKDCFDLDHFGWEGLELVYHSVSCGIHSLNLKFCNQCWNGNANLEYCDMCSNGCKDCFGCSCLTKKQYCILNKQYEEKEYFALKKKIIDQMKKNGEYGQFFPPALSHVPYKDSFGQDYYPLTKEETLAQGYRWADDDPKDYQKPTAELPADLKNANSQITKEIFKCATCGKNYKIIAQEFDFYQKIGAPLPDKCFNCRLLDRLKRKNPRQLWQRKCDKCGHELQTTYAPERLERVYCEECYQKEIY